MGQAAWASVADVDKWHACTIGSGGSSSFSSRPGSRRTEEKGQGGAEAHRRHAGRRRRSSGGAVAGRGGRRAPQQLLQLAWSLLPAASRAALPPALSSDRRRRRRLRSVLDEAEGMVRTSRSWRTPLKRKGGLRGSVLGVIFQVTRRWPRTGGVLLRRAAVREAPACLEGVLGGGESGVRRSDERRTSGSFL
jgi:hypothetical protein